MNVKIVTVSVPNRAFNAMESLIAKGLFANNSEIIRHVIKRRIVQLQNGFTNNVSFLIPDDKELSETVQSINNTPIFEEKHKWAT